jgi:hypothetical protein
MNVAATGREEENAQTKLAAFLKDLTDLSQKHKIGIAVPAELFVLENDDLDLAYLCDADGKLTF